MSRRRNRSQRQYSEKADTNVGSRQVFAACPCSRSTGLHRIARFRHRLLVSGQTGCTLSGCVDRVRESNPPSAPIMPHMQYSIREVPA